MTPREFHYRGYQAELELGEGPDGTVSFIGHVVGAHDLVVFDGDSYQEVARAFCRAVDAYVAHRRTGPRHLAEEVAASEERAALAPP